MQIYLYLGDMTKQRRDYTNKNFIGLSINYSDKYHIHHDVTYSIPLNNNTVDIVQSEDVMEHIEYDKLKNSINEIYRILHLWKFKTPIISLNIKYYL